MAITQLMGADAPRRVPTLREGCLICLAVAFEKMKIKLNAEGLFDPARKRPLPAFPKKIAVVTAPDGAAVQDIIKTITMKNDFVDIIVWPCKVQGKGSAEDIAAGISINEAHLSRVFKKEMNTTVMDYLAGYRIEKAKELLKSGYSLKQASSEVGFVQYTHFLRVFKEITGKTPTQFLKNQ